MSSFKCAKLSFVISVSLNILMFVYAKYCWYPQIVTYWFSRVITLFLPLFPPSLSLSYLRNSRQPHYSKIGLHILPVPSASPSSDFLIYAINCCRYTSRYFYLILSLFLSHFSFQVTELTRYLDQDFPSRRVFRSKFRTHFFSHWKLRHLCHFRDYFCRFVFAGTPRRERKTGERDARENRVC